jgi:hypothetical protein
MRIAISGSHATGKSTLIGELALRLDDYAVFDEPFYLLENEGHAFEHPPSSDDFELLFARSVSLCHEQQAGNVLFDRSPADYLAYRAALDPDTSLTSWHAGAAQALATLDLVVLVPIEPLDRIHAPEAPKLRRRVDRLLTEMFVEGAWGFDVPTITVHGTPAARAEQVLTHLSTSARTHPW